MYHFCSGSPAGLIVFAFTHSDDSVILSICGCEQAQLSGKKSEII
uniref:Uncharacterized protein n=1 Tax=Anguilla anguilla TaxID=7936 RepID=A0A0E9UU70_ANGAN